MPRILTIPEDFNVIYVEGVPHTPEEYRRLWGGVDLDACPEPPITPLGTDTSSDCRTVWYNRAKRTRSSMFTLSDKYKAFAAAVTGLAMVVLAQYVQDPTLLAAIGGVLSTAVVFGVPNRPT